MAGPKLLSKEKNEQVKDSADERDNTAESRDALESIDKAVLAVRKHRKSTSLPQRSRSLSVENNNNKKRSSGSISRGPRCSQDLQTGRTIEYKSGLDTFVFPTPSPRLPTSSSRSVVPSPRHSPGSAPRSATLQPILSDLRSQSPQIGMAIGSPSHVPPSWGRSRTADCISPRIQQRPLPGAPPVGPEKSATGKTSKKQQRAKKTSSWKLFSNMFKKSTKPVPVTQDPFYRMKLDEPPSPPTVQDSVDAEILTAMPPLSAGLPTASSGISRHFHSRTTSDARGQARCESRGSVRTSFSRILRSPREKTTPTSSSPWRGTFFRSERDPPDPPKLHPIPAQTPRIELNLPAPEMERYSVMFSQLLSPSPSNESRPSLLERRLSRLPVVAKSNTLEVPQETLPLNPHSQTTTQFTRSLAIKVDGRRNTSTAPATALHRPPPVMRSQTAPTYETAQTLASSPESRTGSISHSEASLPATPTTVTTCTDTGSINHKLEEKEPPWNMLSSQPLIVSSPDVTGTRTGHSIDLERQMVQVSVARQVSINRARSRVRRTVSTNQPKMVDLIKSRNRKSEVGILDSVENLGDATDEEMPDINLIKEFST